MKNISELKILPPEEIQEIHSLPPNIKRMYFVAGYVDYDLNEIILFRGDGTSLIAPFIIFEPNSICAPDFYEFSIIDFGMAIKLGNYEAGIDTILFAIDPKLREEYDQEIRNRTKMAN